MLASQTGAVGGTVKRVEPPQTPRVEVSPWAVFIGWFLGVFYALVALSLITLLAGLLFPRWLHRVTDHLVPSPWKALLVGFVASIAVPIALLFLAVTIIGAPLALAGLLVWPLMVLRRSCTARTTSGASSSAAPSIRWSSRSSVA